MKKLILLGVVLIASLLLLEYFQTKNHQSLFSYGKIQGKVKSPLVNEASGIAASIRNPGMIWTHNDSGGQPRVFLMDEHGKHHGTYYLRNGINRDWEDMATGPGPDPDKNYLYIAETGSNYGQYPYFHIFRVEEPLAGDTANVTAIVDWLTFTYPDGTNDSECLLVDPLTKDFYIFTKKEPNVAVYRYPYPQPKKDSETLIKLGTIPFSHVVGGDISADGSEILLKTYDKILYWKRKEGESIWEALQRKATRLPYIPEPQGEAICWKKDGSGFYTLSEETTGYEAHLYFYKRNNIE
ncbi:hypothetical protein [Fulvivirga sediminis]|uniref:PE-PGRS family protein n=1 Tax=Fulvivirga sediminis TaxID=2803949 RepID=A0A937F9Q4_9BACT|nr:hypothetical protein [Fulvivirga sediminis]MBL3657826.1 hypothetical protein [Fulvivirga sediminis]